MVAAGGTAGRGAGRAGILGIPGPACTGADGCCAGTCAVGCGAAGGGPSGGRGPAVSWDERVSNPGKGWRGPERIWPGLGAGGAGREGIGMPRGATGGATGRSVTCPGTCPGCPEARGGRSGADRGAGGGGATSTGTSRAAGCGASATGSCLGAAGARDGSGATSATCSTGVSVSANFEPRDLAEPGDPFDSSVSRRLISIATGSSTELEWVFFSVTPSSGSMSRITFGFTSSSRASSLIRILTILCAPPSNSDTGVVRLNPVPYPELPRLPEPLQFLS